MNACYVAPSFFCCCNMASFILSLSPFSSVHSSASVKSPGAVHQEVLSASFVSGHARRSVSESGMLAAGVPLHYSHHPASFLMVHTYTPSHKFACLYSLHCSLCMDTLKIKLFACLHSAPGHTIWKSDSNFTVGVFMCHILVVSIAELISQCN